MLTIPVKYLPWPGHGEQEEAEYVDVVGDENASFAEVLMARLYPESEYAGQIEVRLPDTDAWTFVPIDPEVTMREVSAFAGGEVLSISRVGRGGGLIATLTDWIGAGLTLVGVWDLLRRGHDSLDDAIYRRQRREARRWLVAGTDTQPHLELVQWVKAHPEWALSDLEGSFGLSVADAATLLRLTGYTRDDDMGDYWRELPE